MKIMGIMDEMRDLLYKETVLTESLKLKWKKMEYAELELLCKEVLEAYPDKVNNYRLGKTGLLGLFAGEVMKRSKGLADPKKTISILMELLKLQL